MCLLEYAAFEDEKFMRNYQRGEPSATLYVKNLAKDIDERDLLAVFGAVVPEDVKLRCVVLNVDELSYQGEKLILFGVLLLNAVRSRSGILQMAE